MTNHLFENLTQLTSQLINIIGLSASPLIVLIMYQVFRTRGLSDMTDVQLENRVWNTGYNTIYAQIQSNIHESVLSFYGENFQLPPPLTFYQLAMSVHNNSRSLENLLPIYRKISELGTQSPEFQQVSEMIQQFL